MKAHILVVDDDPRITDLLRRILAYEGYSVAIAASGSEALDRSLERPPDLVVLDIMLPGLDGLEVAQRLRTAGDNVPILMLTARDTVADRVKGLETGADDYLVKPFAPEELVARVKALLRRSQEEQHEVLRYADVELDTGTRVAHRGTRIGIPDDRREGGAGRRGWGDDDRTRLPGGGLGHRGHERRTRGPEDERVLDAIGGGPVAVQAQQVVHPPERVDDADAGRLCTGLPAPRGSQSAHRLLQRHDQDHDGNERHDQCSQVELHGGVPALSTSRLIHSSTFELPEASEAMLKRSRPNRRRSRAKSSSSITRSA